jgi:hypothetical protein
MTIIQRNTPRGRFAKWETLAGSALLAAAAFYAAPRQAGAQVLYTATGGSSTNPNSPSAVTWFNADDWNFFGNIGTLPESYPSSANTAPDIVTNNTSMPSIGVVFDPKDDPNTPGGPSANYVANLDNMTGTFYVSEITTNGNEPATPNKLTVESGTLLMNFATIGRDSPGIIALNGGTFITLDRFKIQGQTGGHTTLGTGTFEYHGGTLETGYEISLGSSGGSSGAGLTSAGLGYFVVYNDGPDGAILSQNGFESSGNTLGMGTMGITEFHYDLNTGGIGGTRPIQGNWNQGAAEIGQGVLRINNGTAQSSRLNLVLDAAPSLFNGVVQNLGLFDETLITGQGTYPRSFYSVDGSTVFTQGATISAAYSGKTYSWTISYSGQINFTDTGTSAYNPSSIQATGGSDVVLIGLVPEPGSLALIGAVGSMILTRRRGRKNRAK